MLQIGYRNPNGTVSFAGNIDVASSIQQLDTDNVPALLLVTGGAVTESGGGISSASATPLQLGVLAGSASGEPGQRGGRHSRRLPTVPRPASSFVNDNRSLTIDALGVPEAGRPNPASTASRSLST